MTLRNFGWALLAVAVLIVGTIVFFSFHHASEGDYGRIVGAQIATPEIAQPKQIVVEEAAPVVDQTSADPMLVSASARAQYLQTAPATPRVTTQPTAPRVTPSPVAITTTSSNAPAATTTAGGVTIKGGTDGHVAIVNGTDGAVQIVHDSATPTNTLRGGIFKPQQ